MNERKNKYPIECLNLTSKMGVYTKQSLPYDEPSD